MNYDRLVGTGARPYRILGWFFIWFALIVALSTFAGMHGWPWRFTQLQEYLLRHPRDNWLFNAFSIYSMRDGDARKTTRIVYVGGSVCLEGIPSDDWMSKALTDRLNRQVRFVSVCSPYQNFADEARIAYALGAFDGMLILGTEPVFFSKVPERQFQARPAHGEQGGNGYFYLPIPLFHPGSGATAPVVRRAGEEIMSATIPDMSNGTEKIRKLLPIEKFIPINTPPL